MVLDVIGMLAVWRHNKNGNIYIYIYIYIYKLVVLHHYEHLFLFSMLILHVTSSRFCLYLLNIYHFTYTFSQNIQRHTHTSTHVQSAHKRNGANQAQEPG